jgi:hypothetical protein
MERNNKKCYITDYDFASLYPTPITLYNIDKIIFRRQKIEKIMQKISDDKKIKKNQNINESC